MVNVILAVVMEAGIARKPSRAPIGATDGSFYVIANAWQKRIHKDVIVLRSLCLSLLFLAKHSEFQAVFIS